MPYLPMSYIYGLRCTMQPLSPLARALREELLELPPGPGADADAAFASVRWDAARNTVADIDLYAPHTRLMDALLGAYRLYERFAPAWLREPLRARGAAFAISYVHAEDAHTNYVDIGPVNKAVNMLAVFFEGGRGCEAFRRHVARVDDYLWVAEDGMKMQGYNGSQRKYQGANPHLPPPPPPPPPLPPPPPPPPPPTGPSANPRRQSQTGSPFPWPPRTVWDTAFATQALATSGLAPRFREQVSRIYAYLDATQVKEDVPRREEFFRTISKGGWPFSTSDHGWPIADCTAEGLKATLLIDALCAAGQAAVGEGESDGAGALHGGRVSARRLHEACDVILALRNPDGGWATYEETRGAAWFEDLNPIESFGDIMIDYTYTELTSSAVQGLAAFQRRFPEYRAAEVSAAVARGVHYVRCQQREDGSFYGSWAVCFTYGCWFGVSALAQGGDPRGADAAPLARCCAFLLSKQAADGGWGESYLSCLVKQYSPAPSSVVNTAWALLALMHARCADRAAVARGVAFLVRRQLPTGDWAQEGCSGIFNRTCAITYTSYRNVFPLWALAVFARDYALGGGGEGEGDGAGEEGAGAAAEAGLEAAGPAGVDAAAAASVSSSARRRRHSLSGGRA